MPGGPSRRVVAVTHAFLCQRDVAEHAKEREEGQRDEPSALLAGNGAHQLEHLRVGDAIELGAKLERGERIEVRGCETSRCAEPRSA